MGGVGQAGEGWMGGKRSKGVPRKSDHGVFGEWRPPIRLITGVYCVTTDN